MRFFKDYPVFVLTLAALLLVFLGGLVLNGMFAAQAAEARDELVRIKRDLNSALAAEPAPTPENLEAAQANLAAMRETYEQTRELLRGKGAARILSGDVPRTGASLLLRLNGAVRQLREQAEELGIVLPDDFAFGLDIYVQEEASAPEQQYFAQIWKQEEIIKYLVRRLYNAKPEGIERDAQGEPVLVNGEPRQLYPLEIVAIEREPVVPVQGRGGAEGGALPEGTFRMPETLSAEEENAVQTLAFRIRFTAYTEVMRRFILQIAEFDLPLVIRSVSVEAGDITQTGTTETGGDNMEEIFNLFGGGQQATGEEADAEAADLIPVVEENLSEFTLVIEFIDEVTQDTAAATQGDEAENAQN